MKTWRKFGEMMNYSSFHQLEVTRDHKNLCSCRIALFTDANRLIIVENGLLSLIFDAMA